VQPEDILISDMYLSENQIRALIEKHKSTKNELIVSSGGKAYGQIWDTKSIVDRIILHTGDNRISDYINPMARNIPAEWISNIDLTEMESDLLKISNELSYCIRATRLTLQHEVDYMYDVCIQSLIPLAILLSLYIKSQVDEKEIKEVIFLSRDSYWIYIMFQMFFPHIKSKYVYFSRLLSSNSIKMNEFITSMNINEDKKLIIDLYGSGHTVNTFLDKIKNVSYLLCFTWTNSFPAKSTNITINNNLTNYTKLLETIFSAPHGSVDENGVIMNPEYDILLLKPYMITINIFKSYYNTYAKYINVIENINYNYVKDTIINIINKPCEHLNKIKEIIHHCQNHVKHDEEICHPIPYFSQIGQDQYYIENIIKFKCNGVFVDIGAYDGITCSNTYSLEKYLNWTGVLVECNPNIIDTCRCNRTSPVCDKAAFNITSSVDFVIPNGEEIIGGNQQLAGIKTEIRNESKEYFSKAYGQLKIVHVNTININELFETYNLSVIDYMSLDIEGGEFTVLNEINFEKYKILYIAVEHASIHSNQERIHNLLISKGYILVRNNKWDDEYMLLE